MRWSRVLTAVGTHSGGEYARVVTGGIVDVPGATVFEKRTWLQDHADHYRRRLLFEPLGGVLHAADILVPATHPEAQLGYVILESSGYAVMSGSNTISVATVILETGLVEMVEPETLLVLESPAGLVRLRCRCSGGTVTSVELENPPSFVFELDRELDVPGLGRLRVDLAWGGMVYAVVRADDLGLRMEPSEAGALAAAGQAVTRAVAALDIRHPVHPEYPGIAQTVITGSVEKRDGTLWSRNAVAVPPGRLDRSACGTGTSARLAVMHARGEIALGETLTHESVLGSRYEARVIATTTVGETEAVTCTIAGRAWITDVTQIGLDPSDPFPEGYTLSDTWGPTPPPRLPV